MAKVTQRVTLAALFILGSTVSVVLLRQGWQRLDIVPKVSAQGKTKTVIVNELRGFDPVEVVKVMGDGVTASVSRPSGDDLLWFPDRGNLAGHPEWRTAYKFDADEDWLSTLSFVVRNRTSKKIDLVAVGVQLPQAAWKGGVEFSFGQLPAVDAYTISGTPIPQAAKDPLNFTPGQMITFSLADRPKDLSRLKTNASGADLVYVDFKVVLEDGVSWQQYAYFRPDPDHPGNSLPIRGHYFPGPLTGPPAPCAANGPMGCL